MEQKKLLLHNFHPILIEKFELYLDVRSQFLKFRFLAIEAGLNRTE